MLSNTAKYAIRSVIYLSLFASESKKAGIKEISEKLKMPAPFLGKILQVLARQKILISTKGPNGGFALGKPAVDITLMDIVKIVDGEDAFDTCIIRTERCSTDQPCSLHNRISASRKEIKNIFLNQTIADLATEFKLDKSKIRI